MRALIALVVTAQAAIAPAATGQVDAWAIRLGERIRDDALRFTVVDRVVLVPDEATYVDEIGLWTRDRRWPVLLEDDVYAPMFIRRFGPKEVVRRESVGGWPREENGARELIERSLLRAWGGESGGELRRVFSAAGHTPSGVVFARIADPAWAAALALAAGRGQPLIWIDDDESLGRINKPMQLAEAERLAQIIGESMTTCGHSFAALGDDIDALTLCFEMSPRAAVGVEAGGGEDHRAVTDLIGRLPDGTRFAFAGWIFGDVTRSAYVAMCSLFVPRQRVIGVNSYPLDEAGWSAYSLSEAAATLDACGFGVETGEAQRATAAAWLSRLPGGMNGDLLLMNTKGNALFFEMFGGDRCYSVDVPVLNEPLAVHFIHSWSAMQPGGAATIGGRWLEHGAYAYVGSVQEPGLGAFLPPSTIAVRLAQGVPFLVACRQWQGAPWRVNTHGDPLMVCIPAPVARVVEARDDLTDLRTLAAELLRQAEREQDERMYAEAIRLCVLIGEDDLAIRTWEAARSHNLHGSAGGAVLPALFRTRRWREFLDAWDTIALPADLQLDMLWHLMAPRVNDPSEPRILERLMTSLREPTTFADIARIAEPLAARNGPAFVRGIIQRELEATDNQMNRRELEKLLRQFKERRGR